MIKRIYGDTLKEKLIANARDRMQQFMLEDQTVRGALLEGTKLANEMRANHELGILETLMLGHAYMGALLMSSNLKGQDRIGMRISCDGPAGGLSVEANAFGEVRGYLDVDAIPLDAPLDSFDLAPHFGTGTLSVTKILERAKNPFTGSIRLEYGNIAQDLANFSARSEQIPSAYNLSVKFDSDGEVIGAGGLMIQALPGSDRETLFKLEQIVNWLPSIGESFAGGREIDTFVTEEFADFDPEILDARRVEFMCHCNRDRFARFLRQLPDDDLSEMATDGPFPLVLTCHNCNTSYEFDREEVEGIYEQGKSQRSSR